MSCSGEVFSLASGVAEIEASSSQPASYGLTEQLKSNSVVVLSVISSGDKGATVRYVVRCGGRSGSWHLRKETALSDFDPALHLVTVCQNGRLGFRSAIADGKLLRCDMDFCLTFASWQLGSQEAWSLRGYALSDCVLSHNKHKLALNVCITILAEPSDSLGNIRLALDPRGNMQIGASCHSPPSAVSTSGQRRKLQRWSWSRRRELDDGDLAYGTARYDDHQSEPTGGLAYESISGSGVENPVDDRESPCLAQPQCRSTFLDELLTEVESSPSRLGKPKLSETQLLAVALHKAREHALTKEKEKDLRWKLQAAVVVLKSLTKQKLELIAQNAKLEAGNKALKEERDKDLQLLLSELSRLRTELWVTRTKGNREQASASYQMLRKSMAAEGDPDLQGSTPTAVQEFRHKPVLSIYSLWAYLPIPIITLAYAASLYSYRRKGTQKVSMA